jgi:hypothetical protein
MVKVALFAYTLVTLTLGNAGILTTKQAKATANINIA